MALDASLLLEKVLEQVLSRCAAAAPQAAAASAGADSIDLIADRIAGQLMGWLGMGDGAGTVDGRPSREALERACGDLAARNQVLASSVGACPCWGEDPACASCHGRGRPGWRPPRREAFGAYVAPALRVLSRRRQRARGARSQHHAAP